METTSIAVQPAIAANKKSSGLEPVLLLSESESESKTRELPLDVFAWNSIPPRHTKSIIIQNSTADCRVKRGAIWERMGAGVPLGLQNRCDFERGLVGSIPTRSRQIVPTVSIGPDGIPANLLGEFSACQRNKPQKPEVATWEGKP